MIKKLASALPVWSQESASAGLYGYNSLVFYQADENSVGYAYKGKGGYTETTQSPDENGNWEIDYSYASPWKEDGEYIIGARVYYFNGIKGYVYVASVRYFGGNGKPNEEVDLDGIRTWEIEMDYKTITIDTYVDYYGNTFYKKSPVNSEFLFPLRKHGGFTGDKTASLYPLDPEERPNLQVVLWDGDSFNGIDTYLKQKTILKADYSDNNSIYQSNPYDSLTYKFHEIKLDSNGNPIHQKKGIHAAQYMKMHGSPSDEMVQSGSRQYAYVPSYFNDKNYGGYYNVHGFSIEMWPTASANDYEFVPSSSLHHFTNQLKPLPSAPYHAIGVNWLGTQIQDEINTNIEQTVFAIAELDELDPTNPENESAIENLQNIITGLQADLVIKQEQYAMSFLISPVDVRTNPYGGFLFNGDMEDPIGENKVEKTKDSLCKFDAFFYRTSPAFSERYAKIYFLRIDKERKYEERILDKNNDGIIEENDRYFLPKVGKYEFSMIDPQSIDSLGDSYTNDTKLHYSREGVKQLDFVKYRRDHYQTSLNMCGWKID